MACTIETVPGSVGRYVGAFDPQLLPNTTLAAIFAYVRLLGPPGPRSEEMGLFGSRASVVCLVLGLILASAHGASAEQSFSSRQGMRLFDAVISLPQPSWHGGSGDGGGHWFEQSGAMAQVIWYPRGARPDRWNRLYGLSATQFGSERPMALDEAVAAVVMNFAGICAPTRLLSETIAADTLSRTFVIYCDTTKAAADAPGYGPEVGEIDLVRVFAIRSTMLVASHRWRGSRFTRDDEITWPVERDELAMMVERFREIRVEQAR